MRNLHPHNILLACSQVPILLPVGLDHFTIDMRIRTLHAIKHLHRMHLAPLIVHRDVKRQRTRLLLLCVCNERLPALECEAGLARLVPKGGQNDDSAGGGAVRPARWKDAAGGSMWMVGGAASSPAAKALKSASVGAAWRWITWASADS